MRGRLLGGSAAAFAALCGCTSTGEEARDRARTDASEHGSFLARALEEREGAARRAATTVRASEAPPFRTPFGDVVPMRPFRGLERSVGGRELNYWVLGDGAETVLVLGGIHGDEGSASEVAYDLLVYLLRHPDLQRELLRGRALVIAPEVNPDGLAACTRRNEHGVDLNRNFPAENWRVESGALRHGPGESPCSEPETRFVLDLIRTHPPARVVAMHAAAHCVNWDGPAETLARRMSCECGLPARSSIGYPTPGSLGSLLGIDRAIPTITFELADKATVAPWSDRYRRALLAAVSYPEPPPLAARSDEAPPGAGVAAERRASR